MNHRKRKVADIALKLFVEKGIARTSIQEIIENAAISKGTFYNYFTSKNDCIADILEYLRYDASQQRIQVQLSKNAQDREVFIEQITILIRLNEERNLNALFEEILYSNEKELRKLVLQHRVIEMEWLENRLIELMGEEIRDYAFEGTVLFYGMLQHMLFTLRITNRSYSLHDLISNILTYVELIIPQMIKNGSPMLNHSAIHLLRQKGERKNISIVEIMEHFHQLKQQYVFNEEQQDLYDAIQSELGLSRIRKVVIKPLLEPFQKVFKGTPIELQVNTFINMVWFYLREQ
ncbi:TetR/AcrR family transcriptional regulator [Niallia sp. XMNu-256]|uniref:TetR/AcrR family transcriptional regulator n=1 Tax=Niallia sp. XMNu-256 TaxID=3082444 RepID=UPI0030D28580